MAHISHEIVLYFLFIYASLAVGYMCGAHCYGMLCGAVAEQYTLRLPAIRLIVSASAFCQLYVLYLCGSWHFRAAYAARARNSFLFYIYYKVPK